MLARIGCLILFFSAALAFWRLTVSYHILQYLATSHRVFLYLIGSIQILRCTQHHSSVLFQPDIDMPQELNPWQTYDTSYNLFQFCYIKSSSFLHLSLSLYQVNRVRENRNLGSAIIAAANVKLKVHTDQVGVLQRSRCEVSKINVFFGSGTV